MHWYGDMYFCKLTQVSYIDGIGETVVFGIQAFCENTKQQVTLGNVTSNEQRMDALLQWLRQTQAPLEHLRDLVEDFVALWDTTFIPRSAGTE